MTELETVVLAHLRTYQVASCWRIAEQIDEATVEDVHIALMTLQRHGSVRLAPTSMKNRRHTAGGTHWLYIDQAEPARKGCGVYTLVDLMDRCVIDEETGCWRWRGAKSNGKTPCVRLPALKAATTLGVAICVLKTGKKPARGRYWHVTCTTPNCANPEHRAEGTRSSQMLSPAAKPKEPKFAGMIAAARRAQSSTCDESKAAAIRASDEPLKVLSDRHGVSQSMVSKIRRGLLWRPMPVRGSSVFAWGAQT